MYSLPLSHTYPHTYSPHVCVGGVQVMLRQLSTVQHVERFHNQDMLFLSSLSQLYNCFKLYIICTQLEFWYQSLGHIQHLAQTIGSF
jgi:hypothetical protein